MERGIQRTFQNISDDVGDSIEQTERLVDMGWYGSFTWGKLLKSKRVLLLSEAGTGKTYECQEEQKELWSLGEPAFYFELAELAKNNFTELMSLDEEERFNSWRSAQSEIATIFLDSIDELKLTLGSFDTALKKLNRELSGNLRRVRIIITSRPIQIDRSLANKYLSEPIENIAEEVGAEAFAKIAMSRGNNEEGKGNDIFAFKYVALLPFSNEQIKEFALAKGISDADALLESLQQKNAIDFVRRPQDLIELCVDWRAYKEIRRHREQVDNNIKIKLQSRSDRKEKVPLSDTKAFEGASRLAIAALLERKFTFRHSAAADIADDIGAALKPASVLPDWTKEEREVLLERPIFGFASYGRVRFHHRSVLERLAAIYLQNVLSSHSASIKAVKRLLFAETPQGIPIVRPSLRPVSAWLTIDEPTIFDEVLRREPNILLDFGDPETFSNQQRANAINAYVDHYGKSDWLGQHVPRIQVHRIATQATSKQALSLLKNGVANPEVREFLFEIIEEAPVEDSAEYANRVIWQKKASYGERLAAVGILVNSDDPRLSKVTRSMADSPEEWPRHFIKYIAVKLFPKHIPAMQLSSILAEIKEPRNHVSDLGYTWTEAISNADLTNDYLSSLSQGLTEKLVEKIEWKKDKWPHLHSTRQHLIVLVAALCLRSLEKNDYSNDVLRACVIATRLYGRDRDDDQPITEIRKLLAKAPRAIREKVFWLDDALIHEYHSYDNSWSRYFEIGHCGALSINHVDKDWVLNSLSDENRPIEQREILLEAAWRDVWEDQASYKKGLKEIGGAIGDNAALMATFKLRTTPTPANKKHEEYERENKKLVEQRKRKEAKNRASWMLFWKEVAENTDKVFSDEIKDNTVWDLWQVMAQTGEGSRSEGWNRKFIEKFFNKETADSLRLAMMELWRKDMPTLYSERPEDKKNQYLTRWELGLTAIYAESEDSDWAANLSSDEAKLAARYAPIQFNGFPSWLESLVLQHSDEVEGIIGSELIYELDEVATQHRHFMMLQDINHASPLVTKIFIPRLHVWFKNNFSRIRENESDNKVIERLRRILEILFEDGSAEILEDIRSIALKELDRVSDVEFAYLWLPFLMRIDADEATSWLERRLKNVKSSSNGEGVIWFGVLFDDHHRHGTQVNLRGGQFSPEMLHRLLRLAYKHVRTVDDQRHDGLVRDHSRSDAERGRSALLDALLDSNGSEAWEVKLLMASDPLFAHFRDRALFLAKEREAQEVDGIARSESDVSAFLNMRELPPKTHGELFSLMMDRLDDIEELLLRDDSPREAWAEITKEKVMRREITRELRYRDNKSYTVDQEAVTVDEKETDIRLRTLTANIEAVIELKLGDKRSAKDLCDTIHDQLVVKYMASEVCGSGCLLVTIAKNRTWKHPETNETLDIYALENFLNEEALRVQNEVAIGKKISVRILNLRPRLKTEKEASTKKF